MRERLINHGFHPTLSQYAAFIKIRAMWVLSFNMWLLYEYRISNNYFICSQLMWQSLLNKYIHTHYKLKLNNSYPYIQFWHKHKYVKIYMEFLRKSPINALRCSIPRNAKVTLIQPKCFTQELSSLLKHSDCPVNSTLMWAKCTQQTDSVSIFFLLVENIKKKTHSVWEYNGGDSTMSVGPALHRQKSCGMNATGSESICYMYYHMASV